MGINGGLILDFVSEILLSNVSLTVLINPTKKIISLQVNADEVKKRYLYRGLK